MRFRYAACFLLATVASVCAAPPEVPPALTAQPGEIVEITVKTDGKSDVGFRVVGGKAAFREMKSTNATERVWWFHASKPGDYSVVWWTNGETASTVTTITVVAPAPPVPPTPPAPPTPPVPPPDAAPIPAAGLHVLVVYDASKLSTLTAEQQGAIFSKDVRDYLRATCPKGADGMTAEWRMWADGTDATGESALWQTAFKRSRASLPWVVVSNGTTGFEGPLPGSATDMLTLLKKYGAK